MRTNYVVSLFLYLQTNKIYWMPSLQQRWGNRMVIVETLRNGQIRTIATMATNMLECKNGANFSIVCTYFWLAYITKSGLSLNNKEILCGELFLAIVFNSCDWSKTFNTKKHPFKVECKCILLHKQPSCRFMHSLCKNETFLCGESTIAT